MNELKKLILEKKIWQYVAYEEALFMGTISTNLSMVNFNYFLKILQWIVLLRFKSWLKYNAKRKCFRNSHLTNVCRGL